MFLRLQSVIFLILFFFSFSLSAGQNVIDIPEKTPVYSSPTILHPPFGIIERGISGFQAFEHKIERLNLHPISGNIDFFKIQESPELWCAPQFTSAENGKPPVIRTKTIYRYFAFLFLLAALAGGICLWKKKITTSIVYPAILVFLHWGYLFWFRSSTIYFPKPVDELSYFKIAKTLASGSVQGPWNYTIGLPFFELILLKLSGWENFYSAEQFLLWFNSGILFPFSMILLFLGLKKLLSSNLTAFLSILIWRIAATFLRFRDFWDSNDSNRNIYKSFFAFPDWKNIYYIYMDSISNCFTALSEPLSLVCIFAITALLLRKRDFSYCMIAGGLFGFSCLIRINNILFAPFFLFLSFSLEQNKRLCWRNVAGAVIAFWIVFAPQLIINELHFGSIFVFPYVLHNPDVAKGFLPAKFLDGAKFLMSVNYFYFILGGISLLFVRDHFVRRALLLWILPLTLFFCGYPEVGNNGIRFLLPVYGALTAAFFAAGLWDGSSPKAFRIMVFLLILQVLFTAPSNYSYTKLLPWNLHLLASGSLISLISSFVFPIFSLLAGICFIKEKRIAYFTVLFSVSYASGFVYLPILLFFLLIIREIVLIRRNFFRKRNAADSIR